jgi:hypothetical protein
MKKLFQKIDKFPQAIQLNLGGRSGQVSLIGGVCTVFMGLIYVLIVTMLTIKLIHRKDPD